MSMTWFGSTTRRRATAAMVGLMAVATAAGPLAAQPGGRGRVGNRPPPTAAQRADMEERFHARIAEIVQRELKLSPDQAQRLQAVTRQFEAQRRPLFEREVALRRTLRRELTGGESADQALVESVLGELLQLQRRRLDTVAAEQRALAEFLTPVQRARYLALQENLRARVEQQRRHDGRPGAPPVRATPPR